MADADAELVLQCQKGSPAAFEALVRQHQRMIHSLTFRMTGSLADAEDLAQETFIRAYAQIGAFRGTSKFSTWLYRIAVNACLNWRQSEARRFHLHADCAGEISAPPANEENSPAKNGACEQVQSALLKLPAKQRAAIVLTVYDGLNHADGAHVLACSDTTVSWRVFASRLASAARVGGRFRAGRGAGFGLRPVSSVPDHGARHHEATTAFSRATRAIGRRAACADAEHRRHGLSADRSKLNIELCRHKKSRPPMKKFPPLPRRKFWKISSASPGARVRATSISKCAANPPKLVSVWMASSRPDANCPLKLRNGFSAESNSSRG